jgi:valyl-tRNA synthetase
MSDPSSKTSLPYDGAAAEARWSRAWQDEGVHRHGGDQPREQTFVIDTPPPTVSGALHIGHVFSYTQTDLVARQRRMAGMDVFYPMGWDDNGLPTERRVQSLYHVRVDVSAPYQPNLELEPGSNHKVPPRPISRPNFIELCARVTASDEAAFQGLWRRLGLSVDWRTEYNTIGDRCRRAAQHSFRDLLAKGHLYSAFAPTLWDVDYQTAIAQAEVEDRSEAGAMHDLVFALEEGGGAPLVIATTRPELLPACVGVVVHPEDPRHRSLIGGTAVTPLFRVPVPIFASPLVDPATGTGVVMVCTFGDATDVTWWRERALPLRQVLTRDGRLAPITFGSEAFPSRDPGAANAAYAALAGKTIKSARAATVTQLREASALRGEPRPLERAVKFFEKGDRPLELIPTRQWFVRLQAQRDRLLEGGDQIQWHPPYMRERYRTWVQGLQQDWCISRQRFFGVPFPIWYPLDQAGQPDHDHPLVAERLPVDPTTEAPPGHAPEARDVPGGFTAERDVFDTWFTSSLTPLISAGWPEALDANLFPADLRAQSHEIIRTWAFYTIAKGLLHEGTLPWRHIALSGWVVDRSRQKMSKSRGNVVGPGELLDRYGADGVRYWAASARLGADTTPDERVMQTGKRLATKVFNAARYVQALPASTAAVEHELDRAFLQRLGATVQTASRAFAELDHAAALAAIEEQFWRWFTDSYLELVKARVRGETSGGRDSAIATLRLGLDVLLRLLAPFIPYVTEEVWRLGGQRSSIHRAPWPTPSELAVAPPADETSLARAAALMATINRRKTEQAASVGRLITTLEVGAHPATIARLAPVLEDTMAAVRAQVHTFVPRPDLAEETFEILRCEVAPPAPK